MYDALRGLQSSPLMIAILDCTLRNIAHSDPLQNPLFLRFNYCGHTARFMTMSSKHPTAICAAVHSPVVIAINDGECFPDRNLCKMRQWLTLTTIRTAAIDLYQRIGEALMIGQISTSSRTIIGHDGEATTDRARARAVRMTHFMMIPLR